MIVSGSRLRLSPAGIEYVENTLLAAWWGEPIAVGDAAGVDGAARAWAGTALTRVFEADWKRYGRRAGPLRNADLVAWEKQQPHSRLIAFPWPEACRGTLDCITQAVKAGIQVRVYPLRLEHLGAPGK